MPKSRKSYTHSDKDVLSVVSDKLEIATDMLVEVGVLRDIGFSAFLKLPVFARED